MRRIFVGLVAVGALLSFTAPRAMAEAGFGIESFSVQATNLDGTPDVQAGGHPYQSTASFTLNHKPSEQTRPVGGPEELVYAPLKDTRVDLPEGFVANPHATPQCPKAYFEQSGGQNPFCPPDTQVGQVRLRLTNEQEEVQPVYNLVPSSGEAAEFGFHVNQQAQGFPVLLVGSVRSAEEGYGLRVTVSKLPTAAAGIEKEDVSTLLTFWGLPADPSHQAQRGERCEVAHFGAKENELGCGGGGQPDGAAPIHFLTNPSYCPSGPLLTTLSIDSWEAPGVWREKTAESPAPTGCESLVFHPSIEVAPSPPAEGGTTQVDTPSGYTVGLEVPQYEESLGYVGLATPEPKDVSVTLPEGVSVSPGAAEGLVACSDAQIDLSSNALGSCPAASQVATVKIITPLLASPLEGQVFLGEPECSPCSAADALKGRLFRLFIQVQGSGVVVKLPGRVSADPSTGRLTGTFDNAPRLPFSKLELHFKGGPRAELANPQSCGPATSTSDLTPWSTPATPDATPSSSFTVDWDGAGGLCPGSFGFEPGFLAQTSTPAAGAFSPFTLTVSRHDGERDLAGLTVHTPPGLVGMLSGVSLCGEPQAAQGTCSEASRIGTTTVAVGAGSHPFWVEGRVYLTGSYNGAPFGLSIVVPAVAGPFNLGNVVVRAAIHVDPSTAALTIVSDPLPQIRDGVPFRIQTVNVNIDRPGFMFNPTNCEEQAIAATIASAQGTNASVSSPFAATGCAGLPFKPVFSASTQAKTSRANGASLTVRVGYPQGSEANIHTVKVDLPKQLPSRLTTLQKACRESVFDANPASCDAGSVLGTATAVSPVLNVPLTGPAIFVSHGGAAFPDLKIVLQGEGVTIVLNGSTFISKKGITSSTFNAVPDVPISSFQLTLPEGPYSALAANGDLCKTKLVMPTRITGQNGAVLTQSTKIAVTGCPKAKPVKKKKKKRKARKATTAGRRHSGYEGGNR